MDPDAELDAIRRNAIGVAKRHCALEVNGVPYSFDERGALDRNAVARRLDEAAAIGAGRGIDGFFTQRPVPSKRAFRIGARQAAIGRDIGGENGRAPAGRAQPSGTPALRKPS
jgi:hypothetical protein